jgi:primosomal protein N' (replication factor Y) (superfamily II helicase)
VDDEIALSSQPVPNESAAVLEKQPHELPAYAEVAIPLYVFQTFTYQLDPDQSAIAEVGSRIIVPLGRNLVTGYIVELHPHFPQDSDFALADIKSAHSVIDSIPVCTPEILQLTRWVSDYYGAPWGEVIKAALPPGISPAIQELVTITEAGYEQLRHNTISPYKLKILSQLVIKGSLDRDSFEDAGTTAQLGRCLKELEQSGFIKRTQKPGSAEVKIKLRRFVRLSGKASEADSKQTEAQLRVVSTLETYGPVPFQSLLKTASVGSKTVDLMQDKGVVEIYEDAVRRDPLAHAKPQDKDDYTLTTDQRQVLDQIERQIAASEYGAFLLHGVTGSGKTEVYIRAMTAALAAGRSAMMLVPEIALTPVFSRRLRAYFGDQVAIFHSSLQRGERFDEWTRVRNGEAKVVIGTRSAVFAPIRNLGVIIIDEEHEATYRQQESPGYNGRDTAIVRAQKEAATVVLGSATPSLESYHNARNGKYQLLNLPDRIGGRPMASAEIIDMRKAFVAEGKPRILSQELIDAIRETHERKEQSIILLNRRGYSSFVLCRSCGESIHCPNCDVTLTYHRSERIILCHYCGHRAPVPNACPACSKQYIYYVGEGTEQLEELVKELIPGLKVARIDRDTTAQKRRVENALLDFSEGRIDTLVGTQMLAKGHDFPNVTLVGVVSVDIGLALPDFRSAERTFQLLTQVAGRAGRGDRLGKVLIQTFHPTHYALRHACAQDYEEFYNEEIRYRQNHSYPPFMAIATLLIRGPNLSRVRNDSLELRRELDRNNNDRQVRILGPAPAPLARLKGEHRFQLLLKARSRRQLRQVVDATMKVLSEQKFNIRSVNLEIDPMSVM